ncbi:MAG: ArsB/NhaD family transporter [Victivallaceae bacterium]|nr:ArsB/NhaD family transporter [Victivallaceae bacterium]
MIPSHMLIVILIFLITYFFIATEKIDKTLAALLGAAAVVFWHAAPFEELIGKIDLNVLALLMGMMMIVNILATTGVFEWIAVKIARLAKGNALSIFISFMTVTALLSAFLDNVTTVILIAPITILIAQILEISAIPFLIMEAVFSNIGGTATLVGDPPNIIIGSRCGVSFNAFLTNLGPFILLLMFVSLLIIYFLAGRKLQSVARAVELINKTNPAKAIIEPARLKSALIIFGLVLSGFVVSRFIDIEPGIIALTGGVVMTLVCGLEVHHVLEKVEWATILFFTGLFMLIGALEINGVFELFGQVILNLTRGNLLLTVIVILWFSACFSAIVDNIPLVIAMIPLINSIIPVFAKQMGLEGAEEIIRSQIQAPLLWALALGACLGGNGTLIGASANVVVVQIARRNKYKISFWQFTRYGFPMMVLSLLLASAYIYLRYFCFRNS